MHVGEIDAENVFPFVQFGDFQDLFALQRAIGLHFDLAQPIIGILEEESLRAVTDAEDQSPAQTSTPSSNLRDNDQHPAVAMLGRLVRPHFHVEQMLLAPLPRVGDTLVPRARGCFCAVLSSVRRSLFARAKAQ